MMRVDAITGSPLPQLFPVIVHLDGSRIADATHDIVDFQGWWSRGWGWLCSPRWCLWPPTGTILCFAHNHFIIALIVYFCNEEEGREGVNYDGNLIIS